VAKERGGVNSLRSTLAFIFTHEAVQYCYRPLLYPEPRCTCFRACFFAGSPLDELCWGTSTDFWFIAICAVAISQQRSRFCRLWVGPLSPQEDASCASIHLASSDSSNATRELLLTKGGSDKNTGLVHLAKKYSANVGLVCDSHHPCRKLYVLVPFRLQVLPDVVN
jgi:hypothetical protein